MFDYKTLITDRTIADVGVNGKGSYNATDLNRVGMAMTDIRDRLNAIGHDIKIDPKTDWTMQDYPTISNMYYYLNCVKILRSELALEAGTPAAPESMMFLDVYSANDIERILEIIDNTIIKIMEIWFYSGELYSGEV